MILALLDGFPDGRRRKRNLDAIEDASPLEGGDHLDADNPPFNASSALSALGYMPHTHQTLLGRGSGPMVASILFSRLDIGYL
jgi:hypothetical protein